MPSGSSGYTDLSSFKLIYKLQQILVNSFRVSAVEEVCTAFHDDQLSIWRSSEQRNLFVCVCHSIDSVRGALSATVNNHQVYHYQRYL